MVSHLNSRIQGTIEADEIKYGHGVMVEPGVYIKARSVVLGDFCYIGHGVRVLMPEFELGSYSKLHAYSFCHGDEPMKIGSCCWIGGNVVLDSNGGLTIENGVGIGAGSQLWTHIQFGDLVQGCRFFSRKGMTVGRDVWFVGHCLVSPVSVGARSMAMLGSLITKDMEPNHVYAGSPAQDVTDKMGPQFRDLTREEKEWKLQQIIDRFEVKYPEFRGKLPEFDVERRTYRRTYSDAEVTFLKENVPLVKFYPEAQ